MSKWIAEFELEDGDTMPEHMDLEYNGAKINFHCRPMWIPCSEITAKGYPNEDGTYYVTEQNYGFYLDADFKQTVAHISRLKNGYFVDRFYDSNHSNITAWMPLPEEPYKCGEQNG